MQQLASDGVTSASEPDTDVRRDYRRDATMLESGSLKWAWRMTVNQALNKFGKKAVKSLCNELLQMQSKGVWRPISARSLTHKERK
jgi:hypothetical protein